MSHDRIPLFEIDWTDAEIKNAIDSITRGSYWAEGPYIDRFESTLESYLGVDHAVVVNSGTAALICALDASDIGPGDEVIVPSFTFIATANAVKAVGAIPVFAEIERERYGLDPASVETAITDDTAAILPVHYAGGACRIADLLAIAREHDLVLVEDAAETLGATIDGELLGTIGDAGVLSFCQNKVAASGEGGAVVTDDEELARRVRLLRSHGRASGEYFESAGGGEYVTLGYNYRIPDVAAAIGVAQMDRVEELIARRRRVASMLTEALSETDGVLTPCDPEGGRHVYQLYSLCFEEPIDRDGVIEHLRRRNIASKVYFDPIHLTTFYRREHGFSEGDLPVTEDVSSRMLSLPMHPNLSPDEVDRITTAVDEAVEETA